MSRPAQPSSARPRPPRSCAQAALAVLATVAAVAACSGPQRVPDTRLEDLQQQVEAQAGLLARQQQRIEELEVRVATLAQRASVQPSIGGAAAATGSTPLSTGQEPTPGPAPFVPRSLQTIKLSPPAGGRRPRLLRPNPVERAPRLPAQLQLREPDEAALAALDRPAQPAVDPEVRAALDADHAFAQAVQHLNDGEHAEAQAELLAFAAAHPRHAAADNAIYLAGLSRAATGDCAGALPLFDRVPAEYPAGDAIPGALLEKGRCLSTLKRPEAASTLTRLTEEFPDSPEASQARQLLDALSARR